MAEISVNKILVDVQTCSSMAGTNLRKLVFTNQEIFGVNKNSPHTTMCTFTVCSDGTPSQNSNLKSANYAANALYTTWATRRVVSSGDVFDIYRFCFHFTTSSLSEAGRYFSDSVKASFPFPWWSSEEMFNYCGPLTAYCNPLLFWCRFNFGNFGNLGTTIFYLN